MNIQTNQYPRTGMSMVRRDSATEGILSFDCSEGAHHHPQHPRSDSDVLASLSQSFHQAVATFREMAEEEMEESKLDQQERLVIQKRRSSHQKSTKRPSGK